MFYDYHGYSLKYLAKSVSEKKSGPEQEPKKKQNKADHRKIKPQDAKKGQISNDEQKWKTNRYGDVGDTKK